MLWLCSWCWKVSGLDTSTRFKSFWVQPLSKDYGWLPLLLSQENLIKSSWKCDFFAWFWSSARVHGPLQGERECLLSSAPGALADTCRTLGHSGRWCWDWRCLHVRVTPALGSDVCLSDLTWEECGVLECWSSWKIIRQAGLRDFFSTSPCCNFF